MSTSENLKRVLITGASGLLGRTVYKYFTDDEFALAYPLQASSSGAIQWKCLGLCHSRARPGLVSLDLSDYSRVDKLIEEEFRPDVIIHCAAEKKVEAVEANFDKALELNSGVTGHLAEIAARLGIFFVYISTDYVFDGTKPPYVTGDQPNPINKYGLSKFKGEEATRKASDKHVIVRVPVLYGFTEPNKLSESAINILYERVAKTNEAFVVDHAQVRFPTHTIDVARFLAQLIIKHVQAGPIQGTLHCSAPEAFTKYEMSLIIAEVFGISSEHIKPDTTSATTSATALTRPMNAKLDTSESFSVIDFQAIVKFKDVIKQTLDTFA